MFKIKKKKKKEIQNNLSEWSTSVINWCRLFWHCE